MAQNDNILVRSLVEDQGRDCQQGVEPSTCLVYGLGDEICRELLLKEFLILKRIMMLCERHGTGIEPAVDYLRYTVHLLTALRTGDGDIIDERTMQLYLAISLFIHLFCIFLYNIRIVRTHGLQLCLASDGMLTATLTLPDIKRVPQ